MVIDWNAIAVHSAIRALGGSIRRRWGVWLGVLDQDGQAIAIADPEEGIERPLCSCFKANPIPVGEGGEIQTCARALREWADERGEGRLTHRRCHAGLSAWTIEVRAPGGARVGQLYLSGVLPERSEAQDLIEVRRALRRARVEAERVEESWFDAVPRFSASEETTARALLEILAEHVEAQIAAQLEGAGGAKVRAREAEQFCGMIGASPPMRRLFHLIGRVARTNSTVLILGENGTGKELVARALHQRSRRSARAFIVQNCAAIPAELIESELFGHKRGAFSGAHRDRQGLFEVANHGTFFLDEIGEMDLSLQAKMLRVLQEGTFLPVGDSTFRKVDVRMICATNRDLEQMVRQGDFREDLFYRINVITLVTPPLRERPGDIPLLVGHFLSRAVREHGTGAKELHPETLNQLVAYRWPGNVRELENEVERMVILSGDERVIGPDALSPRIGGARPTPASFGVMGMKLPEAVEQLERQMILQSLRDTGWNKTQTAKNLGVSRRNLIRKVARFGFEEDDASG